MAQTAGAAQNAVQNGPDTGDGTRRGHEDTGTRRGQGDTAVNSQLSFLVVSLIKAVAIQLRRPRLGTALPQRLSV